ncbi:MAG: hypothetical protein AAGU27_06490 [Dehalobacterium sp.]
MLQGGKTLAGDFLSLLKKTERSDSGKAGCNPVPLAAFANMGGTQDITVG